MIEKVLQESIMLLWWRRIEISSGMYGT